MIARAMVALLALVAAGYAVWRAPNIARAGLASEEAALGYPLPLAILGIPVNDLSKAGTAKGLEDKEASALLLASPLDANAIWKRGQEVEPKHPEQAIKLAALAGKMTRRHFPSTAWLLEEAAREGSVDGTLTQYDILLTLWPELGQRLYPQLAYVGGGDESVRNYLLRLYERPWYRGFLSSAAQTNGRQFLPHLSRFVQTLKPDDRPAAYGVYLTTMLAAGDVAAVRNYALREADVPDALVNQLQPGVDNTDSRWGRVAWRLTQTPNAVAELAADGKTVEIEVAADSAAPMMTRTTLFKPGTYRIDISLGVDPMAEAPRLSWTLLCERAGDPKSRQRVELGDLDTNRSTERLDEVVIPSGCDLQEWSVRAIAGEGQSSKRVRVLAFDIRPVGD